MYGLTFFIRAGAGIENKTAAFDRTPEPHEHMVYFWRELVDLSDSAVASAELSGNDQDAGRARR